MLLALLLSANLAIASEANVSATFSAPAFVSQTALAPGAPAPFAGILLSPDRMIYLSELALDGKAAREGAFTLPFWKTATLIGINAVLVGIETYRLAHKR